VPAIDGNAVNHAGPAAPLSSFARQQKQRPDPLLNRAADL
jgi:hypothetical protein